MNGDGSLKTQHVAESAAVLLPSDLQGCESAASPAKARSSAGIMAAAGDHAIRYSYTCKHMYPT